MKTSFFKRLWIYLFLTNLIILFLIDKTFAQIEISGKILDGRYGNDLSGAIIQIQKTKKGTSSDIDGNFRITVKDTNAILIFSSIGFKTQKIKVGKQRTINLTMLFEEHICTESIDIKINDEKPIIYLYPDTIMDIKLKLQYNGKLKTTYPLYNNGWNIHVFPNGDIINIADGKEYSYLFWDGITNYTIDQTTYDNGFVISSDTALTFLQNILPKTGLKPREYNEFIVYWLPFLQANRLTFVHFRTGDNYNVISKNEVIPKPDTQIRVFMEFKTVDAFFKVNPQIFTNSIRQGFTLVEWGGSMLTKAIKVKDENGVLKTR